MFVKFVEVDFLGAPDAPNDIHSAYIRHNRYEHEIAVIKFRDWGLQYESIEPGTPVTITYGVNEKRTMYGYVHHISGERTVNNNFTEITFIGASFPMKQQSQKIYRDMTGDQIIAEIARKYGFSTYLVPHTRVWPQVAQSGESDWSMMVKVAKKCGYSLRTENTSLFFQPMMAEYALHRNSAPRFMLRLPGQPKNWSMYSFTPIIGDSIPYEDSSKGAVAVAGMDYINSSPMKVAKQKTSAKTRRVSKPDIFDKFAVDTVVVDQETAAYEAAAADERNSFPYRAEATLLGNTSLRPDMPVFLDGIGEPYSGYWTVLEATHIFEEKTRGVHTYTTEVVVGTDSLGEADVWTDGKRVQYPAAPFSRIVDPTIKNTQKRANITLAGNSYKLPKQVRGPFTRTENKPAPNTKVANTAPVWKSDNADLVRPDKKSTTPYHVVSRLQKKGLR